MVEPSGHCPYLGLKQNQAIRFASPTPEHRCYATGQAQEIPTFEADYQARYCLSSGHIKCPLYTGSGLPSTPAPPPGPLPPEPVIAASGMRGWFAGLTPRDRAIYIGLLALLVFIFGVYTVAGLNLLRSNGLLGGGPELPSPGPPTALALPTDTAAPATDTAAPPSATPAAPTDTPVPPTDTAAPPSATALPPSATPVPPTSTPVPPPPPPTETPTITATPAELVPISPTSPAPTDTPAPPSATPTSAPPTQEPTSAPPTGEPTGLPVETPAIPPTDEPTFGPTVEARTPGPQPPPEGQQEQQRLTVYFTDATGTIYVSVARLSTVVDKQVATAAINGLIAGPGRAGLERLIPPETRLIAARREGSRLVANFDRRPAWAGDDRGLYAIAYTLTEFGGVNEVQIQVNGANIGVSGGSGPIPRKVLNPDNPQQLNERFDSGTRFLPLYFLLPTNDGPLWVRVTRLIPRTDDVARATLEAMLAGPGSYGLRVYSPIPEGTKLSGAGLRGDGDRVVVDLSREFLAAYDKQAAVNAVVLSLTELRDQAGNRQYRAVEILVEGHKLSDEWGAAFDRQFTRPALNPQG